MEKGNEWAFEPYPVFYFDFNGQNYQSNTALEDVLDRMLMRWEDEYGCKAQGSLSDRFQTLLMAAWKMGTPKEDDDLVKKLRS